MSGNLTRSALTSRLAMSKMYNASAYSNASHAICAYSYMIGKILHGYSEIDLSVSSMLQSSIHAALQAEYKQDIQQMAVKSLVLPVIFAEPNYSGEADAESETLQLLINLNALETHSFQVLENAEKEPAAQEISVVSIPGLVAATKFRVREIQRIFKEIQGGIFWTRPEGAVWICLQCGYPTKSPNAFEECQCCGAGREFAS